MKALGIDENTPAPAGGTIQKKDGRLTGYLEENALIEAMQKIPMPTPEELEGAYLEAQERYASYGIATMQEGMVMDVMTGMFELLCQKKLLKLDLIAYADFRSCDLFLKKFKAHIDRYQDHLKIGGYKVFLDGSPQARTAWLTKPYENGEGECGYPTMTDEQLTERINRSLREGRQLLAHCNGDAAAQQYLNCFNRATGTARRCAGHSPGDDSCPNAAPRPVAFDETARHDAILLCGARLPLGRCASPKFRQGTCTAHQLCGFGLERGHPLYVSSGFAGY